MWTAYLSGGFGLSVSAMLGLLVPLRADELGVSVAAIGVIVAARSLAEAVLAVPLSMLILRLGTRRAFVASTATCAGVAVAFTLADGFALLLLLNVAMGAGRSLGWVASQTYISSQGKPEDRARDTGRFSFASNASQMVAPLMIGAAAAAFGYRVAFLFIAGYCLLFAVVGIALPPATDVRSGTRVRLMAAAALFRLPRLQVAMLLSFVRLWVPNIWTPFFPLLLVAAGFSPQMAGAVISSAAAVAMVANLATGWLSRYAPPEVLCTAVLGVSVVGLVLSPHMLSVPAVFIPAAMVGLGNGLSLPLLIVLVSDAAPPGQRGLALATRNAVNSLAASLGPLGTGPLVAAVGAAGAFSATGGLAASLIVAVIALQRRAGGREPAGSASDGPQP
jgi:DHA1 family inner membrane transport protein